MPSPTPFSSFPDASGASGTNAVRITNPLTWARWASPRTSGPILLRGSRQCTAPGPLHPSLRTLSISYTACQSPVPARSGWETDQTEGLAQNDTMRSISVMNATQAVREAGWRPANGRRFAGSTPWCVATLSYLSCFFYLFYLFCLGLNTLVGENVRYVAKIEGAWIALLGWSGATLRVTARDRYLGRDAEMRA